jgi:GntR family transcriptional regulator
MHTHQQRLIATLSLKQDGVPIYVQLREQVLQALAARLLGPGDQMPTMREVATAMKVDLNTVRHAYDELERLGAITLVRGRGSFVAAPPTATAPPQDQTDDLARQAIVMAAAIGIAPLALAERIAVLSQKQEESS